MPDLEAVPAHHPATSLRCLLLLAITVGCDVQAATDSATSPTVAATSAAATDQSFLASTRWSLAPANGGIVPGPSMLADVNGDGKQDMVVFGRDGTTALLSTSSSFTPVLFPDFGSAQGWNTELTVRTMADIDGDRRADIVGFGRQGVFTALSTGDRFAPTRLALRDFGADQGWNTGHHTRLLGDVNGDGRKDIVGFGQAGVFLSLSSAAGAFGPATFVVAELGADRGWTGGHLRTLADVDGDRREDIVAFGDAGVWVATSTSAGFGPASFVLADYGTGQGWSLFRHDRQLVDVDGDGRTDIVGFGDIGTTWSRSLGGGGFGPVTRLSNHFGNDWLSGTTKWRRVADFNADSHPDLVFASEDALYRILGGPDGMGMPRMVLRDMVPRQPGFVPHRTRFVGDADGDGLPDLVGIGNVDVRVARSTAEPPPAPPANPTGARVLARTNSQVKIAWNDNATDERAYIVWYGKAGTRERPDISYANVQTRVLGLPEFTKNLDPDTDYCFTLQAESVYGLSARSTRVCTRTDRGNRFGPPIDPGITFVCGAPGVCPAGFHAADYEDVPICPNGGLTDNRTVCAANLDAFTVCGSCPTGFFSPGGMSLTEYACTLPDATPSRPLFGNASRCAVQTVSP